MTFVALKKPGSDFAPISTAIVSEVLLASGWLWFHIKIGLKRISEGRALDSRMGCSDRPDPRGKT